MRFINTHSRPWNKTSTENAETNNKVLAGAAADKDIYEPRTELGKKLMEIRKEAIAEGMQLKSLEELERENETRKGTIL